MAVKGPRLHTMVVTSDRPGRRRLIFLGLLLFVVVVGVVGWFGGRWSALLALSGADGGVDAVLRLDQVIAENRSMREELAVYRNGGDVAQQVEERVRVDNRELQDRVAELEQAIAYYRRIAVPDRSGKGLRIERLTVAAGSSSQAWSLDVLLVRTGETDGTVEGRLEGRVIAIGPSGSVELPLAQVLAPGQQTFRVRYIDDLRADLRLPPGLTPVRVDLVAVLTAPREERIEKSWLRQVAKPQEVPVNAGQG